MCPQCPPVFGHSSRSINPTRLGNCICTILGLVPLALGLGPGAQMQQPLAIAVIGGLTANMIFTRLLIPVGYLAIQPRRRVAAT